jgi:hypothetical protein
MPRTRVVNVPHAGYFTLSKPPLYAAMLCSHLQKEAIIHKDLRLQSHSETSVRGERRYLIILPIHVCKSISFMRKTDTDLSVHSVHTWDLLAPRPVLRLRPQNSYTALAPELLLMTDARTDMKERQSLQSEPASTSAPGRMNGKWSGNSFVLGSSSLANYGG